MRVKIEEVEFPFRRLPQVQVLLAGPLARPAAEEAPQSAEKMEVMEVQIVKEVVVAVVET